jgi:hypothetical protein
MTVRTTVRINLNVAGEISQEAVLRGVRGATIEAKARLKGDVLGEPGTGRTYTHKFFTDKQGRLRVGGLREGGPHTASAPGRAPAPDTGRLRQSVQSEVFSTPEGALGVVSVNAEYAEHLQFGTEKVAPRPFMDILIREYSDRIRAAFEQYARVT